MRSLVRLRVELDDRPGSLAAVAAAIARRDGNITAIDVLEADGGRVVDEITIDTPADLDMDLLRGEIAGVRDARVLSQQRAELRDPITRLLRRVTLAIDHLPGAARDELRRAVADLCDTPAVAVLDAADAEANGVGHQALLDPGRATLARSGDDLAFLGEAMTGDASVVAIATSVSGCPVVVVAGRPAAQGFTPTECERIEALVALHARLLAVVDFAHEEARGPGVR